MNAGKGTSKYKVSKIDDFVVIRLGGRVEGESSAPEAQENRCD